MKTDVQSLPYDPHSINLQILKFLQISHINHDHNYIPNVVKYGLNHNQKENLKKVGIFNDILRPKGQKIKEKSNDLLPLNSAPPSKSLYKTQKLT